MSAIRTTSPQRPINIGFKWRYLLLIPLIFMAIFYLIPLYVMLITGFKSFEEDQPGHYVGSAKEPRL